MCLCVWWSRRLFSKSTLRAHMPFSHITFARDPFLCFFGKLFACSAIRLSMSGWKNHTLFLSLPILSLRLLAQQYYKDNGFFLWLMHLFWGHFSWDICLFYFVYNVVSADKLLVVVEPWCFWNVTHEVDICWCESSEMFVYVCIFCLYLYKTLWPHCWLFAVIFLKPSVKKTTTMTTTQTHHIDSWTKVLLEIN